MTWQDFGGQNHLHVTGQILLGHSGVWFVSDNSWNCSNVQIIHKFRLCRMRYECDAPIQKAEIESNLRTDEVVARRVDGMWARTEGKIGELRMQLEHGLRAIVAQQVNS